MEKKHSVVKYVAKTFIVRQNWLDTLEQFMKERNHSDVTYVTTESHELHQFMKGKSCDICDYSCS